MSVRRLLFAILLRFYPRDFRRRFRRDLLDLWEDAWDARAQRRSLAGRVVWTAVLVGDVALAGTRQRLAPRRRPRPVPGRPVPRRKGDPLMTRLRDDLLQALKSFRYRPGFVLVVVVVLGLGIGANTAMFGVLEAVLMRPLPYRDAEQLVRLYRVRPDQPDYQNYLPGPAVVSYRDEVTSLDGLAALYDYRHEGADLGRGPETERVAMLRVGADYFDVLAQPMIGRGFRSEEERPQAQVAVISHRVWDTFYSGTPEALGSSLPLDGVELEIVGVMPDGFRDPLRGEVDVWVPQNLQPGGFNNWDNNYLSAIGRLRPGISLAEAQAEVDTVAQRQASVLPEGFYKSWSGRLVPLKSDVVGPADRTVLLLMAAVGLVLLLACANVANLCLVDGATRGRELFIRAAMGSSRLGLVRRLLLESLLLAACGGVAGLAVGAASVRALVALSPGSIPRLETVSFDPPVFLFCFGVALLTGLLFGLLPALRYSKPSSEAAHAGARGSGGSSRGEGRLRRVLVVAEVGLALVLVFAAGLLIKSLGRLGTVDLGFEDRSVVTFEVNLPGSRYQEGERRARFHERFQEELRALPGVVSVGAISVLPATGSFYDWGVRRISSDGEVSEEGTGADQRVIEGDLFSALDVTLLAGRPFDNSDHAEGSPVVIVNRRLAERLFQQEDPVGQLVRVNGARRVVGVVEDTALDPTGASRPMVYHPHRQLGANRNWSMVQVVRLEGEVGTLPGAVIQQARERLAAIDPDLVLFKPTLLSEVIQRGVAEERFATYLLASFGGLGLLLAAIGVYGVLAYSVARQRQAIGIRMAIGADRSRIHRLVLGETSWMVLGGLVLGGAGALLVSRTLRSLLFEVDPADPTVLLLVGALLAVVGYAASWIPAARASRVDPIATLRAE